MRRRSGARRARGGRAVARAADDAWAARRVQNMFHSVQLNINNPHFLIMQGRITKEPPAPRPDGPPPPPPPSRRPAPPPRIRARPAAPRARRG